MHSLPQSTIRILSIKNTTLGISSNVRNVITYPFPFLCFPCLLAITFAALDSVSLLNEKLPMQSVH